MADMKLPVCMPRQTHSHLYSLYALKCLCALMWLDGMIPLHYGRKALLAPWADGSVASSKAAP